MTVLTGRAEDGDLSAAVQKLPGKVDFSSWIMSDSLPIKYIVLRLQQHARFPCYLCLRIRSCFRFPVGASQSENKIGRRLTATYTTFEVIDSTLDFGSQSRFLLTICRHLGCDTVAGIYPRGRNYGRRALPPDFTPEYCPNRRSRLGAGLPQAPRTRLLHLPGAGPTLARRRLR